MEKANKNKEINETLSDLKTQNGNNEKAVSKPKSKPRQSSSSTKIRDLKKKIETLNSEKKDLKDQLLRKAAEFENFKKRRENEYSQLVERSNAQLITELLPVLDDYDRSIKSAQETEDFKALLEGVQLIYKNLAKTLEKRGVQPIEAVGHKFDPEKHDALMQVDNNEHPPGTVIEEHLKGYVMNDRVLRHSQVLVNKL